MAVRKHIQVNQLARNINELGRKASGTTPPAGTKHSGRKASGPKQPLVEGTPCVNRMASGTSLHARTRARTHARKQAHTLRSSTLTCRDMVHGSRQVQGISPTERSTYICVVQRHVSYLFISHRSLMTCPFVPLLVVCRPLTALPTLPQLPRGYTSLEHFSLFPINIYSRF